MRHIKWLTPLAAAAAILVLAAVALADPGPFPGGPANESMTSIGSFRIYVAPPFRSMLTGCSLYNSTTFRLQSPTMSDPNTVIGLSDPIIDGSAADLSGVAVGTPSTIISDSSAKAVPTAFQDDPPGAREVHTELRSMNLTLGSAAVRAGTAVPGGRISPGEAQSKATGAQIGTPANDFPARSFFDVFVEVDLPACPPSTFPGGTLYNFDPLIVANENLTSFPPKVVYTHTNSSAVAVYFKSSNPPYWYAGEFFGWLVLAGHGAGYDGTNPADVAEFQATMTAVPEMLVPTGGIAEAPDAVDSELATAGSSHGSSLPYAAIAGAAAAGVIVLATGGWYVRRRRLS